MSIPGGKKCFADFASEVELQCHLMNAHKLSAKEVSSDFCENMRLGENGSDRFWCGFCQKVIEQTARIGCDPREMRMQHVGDHFDQHDFSDGNLVYSKADIKGEDHDGIGS